MMTEVAVKIRVASEDDVGTIVYLGIKTFRDTFEKDNTSENMQEFLETNYTNTKIAGEMNDQRSVFFIAEIEGNPVGFAKVRWSSELPEELAGLNAIEIERLYAVQDHIGKGIGPALMSKCLEFAKSKNFQLVWLGVWEHNPRAIRFYEKYGFEKFSQHIFMVGQDPQIDLLMKKTL